MSTILRRFRLRGGAALAVLVLVSAGSAQKPIQFKGRFFALEAQFKIKIDSFSTPEEIAKIKEALFRQDFENFYKTLWTMDKGVMQFIGVVGESLLLATFPAGHTVIRESLGRFILFDGSGLLLLALAAFLSRK